MFRIVSHSRIARMIALLLIFVILAGCSLWAPAEGTRVERSPASTVESALPTAETSKTQPADLNDSNVVDSSFAIHLVAGTSNPRDFDQAELDGVELEYPPLIQDEDIVRYELETHEIELSEQSFERVIGLFELPVDTNGIPFVVAVSGKPVYSGAFYTPASSLSYNGVVILQPLGGKPRTITLTLGYPSIEAFEGRDPRADPRILQVLRELGFNQSGSP